MKINVKNSILKKIFMMCIVVLTGTLYMANVVLVYIQWIVY